MGMNSDVSSYWFDGRLQNTSRNGSVVTAWYANDYLNGRYMYSSGSNGTVRAARTLPAVGGDFTLLTVDAQSSRDSCPPSGSPCGPGKTCNSFAWYYQPLVHGCYNMSWGPWAPDSAAGRKVPAGVAPDNITTLYVCRAFVPDSSWWRFPGVTAEGLSYCLVSLDGYSRQLDTYEVLFSNTTFTWSR
jgi:hypothetical protein